LAPLDVLAGVGPSSRRHSSSRIGASSAPVSSQHICQFYETDQLLCDAVARFLADGIDAHQPVLLLATREHTRSLARPLAELGHSFEDAERSGRLTAVDADAALASFMDDDLPDGTRFVATVNALLDRAASGGESGAGDGRVRIFAEMVDVLWRAGRSSAALRLEELWNELAESRPFELLCGYSIASFDRASHEHSLDDVCARHARALPAHVFALPIDGADREGEITMLRQRARSLEAELLEARVQAESAARVKSDFLALMSHELRTPLNAILGYQDLLDHQVGGPISAEQRAYLSRMRSCSHQLLRLIDQVLTLARLEATTIDLDQEVVDVADVARDTVSLMESGAARRGLFLDFSETTADTTLVTDPVALRQILLNVLTNAVKFTETGGVWVRVGRHDGSAWIEVRDTGIGIRPEDQERIFEPFVQVEGVIGRRYGGSGLGLAVSRDLARALGGDLAVQSELGHGSTFTLRLPVIPPLEA
jgi:signal transduction histidine kinase